MAFIEMKGLSHIFHQGQEDEFAALQGIDLQIEEGEFVAVLGANGSGKSTLAKHINALLLPSEGSCLVDGMDTRDDSKVWDIRQRVGMVFQNPDNQMVAAVVEDDVAFGPENLGMAPKEIRERVRSSLEMVGMEDYRRFAPHLLSGGQKQRVAIAGALAMRTKCLILDEPTAMLDPVGRRDVLAAVKKLHRAEGMTIVYITHFPEEAAEAERLLVMEHGALIEDTTPKQAFADGKRMQSLGLDVPFSVELADALRKQGLKLPREIYGEQELLREVLKALGVEGEQYAD